MKRELREKNIAPTKHDVPMIFLTDIKVKGRDCVTLLWAVMKWVSFSIVLFWVLIVGHFWLEIHSITVKALKSEEEFPSRVFSSLKCAWSRRNLITVNSAYSGAAWCGQFCGNLGVVMTPADWNEGSPHRTHAMSPVQLWGCWNEDVCPVYCTHLPRAAWGSRPSWGALVWRSCTLCVLLG